MIPTDEDRYVILAPLLADLIQDILDEALYKAPPESHIEVEHVGDCWDASSSEDDCLICFSKAKSMLTADQLAKKKLRQRLRLMFAPDVETPTAMQVQQPKDTGLGTKLTPSPSMARLETRLDTLAKRLLTLDSMMDTMFVKIDKMKIICTQNPLTQGSFI